MWNILPSNCPTELGYVKDQDSSAAHLLRYAIKGRSKKVKRLLKQGTDVELLNSAGQTALFLAALFGHSDITEILVHCKANVNHRCKDGSTPVHAAAFSCQGPLLLQLLSAGGDLRLHDQEGRTPQDWAEAAGSEQNAEVLQCMYEYQTHISLMFQCSSDPGTIQIQQRMRSNSLRNLCSLSSFLLSPLRLFSLSRIHRAAHKTQQALEKLCLGGLLCSGLMASTPVAAENELLQVDIERDQTYESGPYILMRNLLWRGQFVTVRELKSPSHPGCSKPQGTIDLLITEQQHCSHLHHPNLLLLMAVCLSPHLRLVYERVEVGSLYCLLHKRYSEFPVKRYEMIIHLLLQVCEALMFLHSQGYVHRTITSHAIHIVTLNSAKLSNLEYMQLSDDKTKGKSWSPPIPPQFYNWLPLEVIQDRPATSKSDCYSFCTVIQEMFTDAVPWNHVDGQSVKEMMESGCSLTVDCRVPQPYYLAVKTDLSLRARDRTISLPDIRYNLRKDLREHANNSRIPKLRDHSIHVRGFSVGTSRSCRAQQDMIDGNIPTPEPSVLTEASQKDLLYYEIDTDSTMSSGEKTTSNPHRQGCTITETSMGHSSKQRGAMGQKGNPSRQQTAHSFSSPGSLNPPCDAEESNNLYKASSMNNSSPHSTLLPQQWQRQLYGNFKISTDSESSLVMEVTTEYTEESDMDLSSTKSFCMDIVSADVLDTSICHPSDSVSFCENNFLSSLKESANLLEKANTSLECLEKHFLTSIDTLQEFASHTTLSPNLDARSRELLRLQKRELVATMQQRFAAEMEIGPAFTTGSGAMEITSESEVRVSDYERKPHVGEDLVDTVKSEQCERQSIGVAGLSLDLLPMMCYQSPSQSCKTLKPNPAARCCESTMLGIQYSQSEEALPWARGRSTGVPKKKETCGCQKTPYRCCAVTEQGNKGCRPQRWLSLQSIIDLTSYMQAKDVQRDRTQNTRKKVPDNTSIAGCSRNTMVWLSPNELEEGGTGPQMQLESLDLMQEIINELNGAGEPAHHRTVRLQAKRSEEDSRDITERRDGMNRAEVRQGKTNSPRQQDCGDGACQSANI